MSKLFQNAWHNVRGITSEEMMHAAKEAERIYGDIIDLPRPVSVKHPPLSMEQKAAQYSPFAALTGYGDVLDETERLTEERKELDEDRRAELDRMILQLVQNRSGAVQAAFTYFIPDPLKAGGKYVTVSGSIRRIDQQHGKIILQDGTQIPVNEIIDIRKTCDR